MGYQKVGGTLGLIARSLDSIIFFGARLFLKEDSTNVLSGDE
jgi:hypothetical protein